MGEVDDLSTGLTDRTSKMNGEQSHRIPVIITKVLSFILIAILPLTLGVYLMLFADWFALGLPLALIGATMIVTYLSMRRTPRD
jgi:hypothetical protein